MTAVWDYFATEWSSLTDREKLLYQRIWLASRRDYAMIVIPLWAQTVEALAKKREDQ